MNKVAWFLILIVYGILQAQWLYAFDVKITKLSETPWAPLPDWYPEIYVGPITAYTESFHDVHVATITLAFGINEIGQDVGATILLARRECKKLGADSSFYISGTEYTETKEIASVTFRCIQSETAGKIVQGEAVNQELRKTSRFYNKMILYIGKSTKDIDEEKLGMIIKQDGTATDKTTGKAMTEDQISDKVFGYFAKALILFYKDNIELYKSEYNQLLKINEKYPKAEQTYFLAELDSDGNINYEKFKAQVLAVLKSSESQQ